MKRIDFYKTLSGKSPVEVFLETLSDKQFTKIAWVLKLKVKVMDDLDKYIEKRKKKSPEFARTFDQGYEQFKIGVLLKQARKEAGLTQEQVAEKLNTKKSAISRIENHAEDIRLSTLETFAQAVGKNLRLELA